MLAKAYVRWGRMARMISRTVRPPDARQRQPRVVETAQQPRYLSRCGGGQAGVVDAAVEDKRDALWGIVRALPPRQRTVIVLRYYEDLDDATIAAILDCSTGTVARTRSAPLTPCASGGARRLLRWEPAVSFDLEKRLAMTLTAHEGWPSTRRRSWQVPHPWPAPAAKARMVRVVGVAAACLMLAGAAIWLPISGGVHRAPLPGLGAAAAGGTGKPGAASRPDLVGSTPGAVSTAGRPAARRADRATWTGPGHRERGAARRIAARVMLARDRAALDEVQQTLASSGSPQQPVEVRVNGRPGDASYNPALPSGGQGLSVVRMATGRRPLGAALDLHRGDLEAVIGTASLVRFDEARRCVVPFRLESLPAGTRLQGCSRSISASTGRGASPRARSWSATRLVVGSRYGRSVCPSGSATQQASFRRPVPGTPAGQ